METTKPITSQKKWNEAHKDIMRKSNRDLYNRNKHDPEFMKRRNDTVKRCYYAKKEREKALKIQLAKDIVDKEIQRQVDDIKEEMKQKFDDEVNTIINNLNIYMLKQLK